MEPDSIVIDRSGRNERRESAQPLLVVAIEAPSSRDTDRTLKRDEYQQGGAAAYWLLDPDIPRITAFGLVDARYQPAGQAPGTEAFVPDHPFALSVVPADRLR